MVSPGQVLGDVDPKELEAADPLYCCPIDGDGGVSYSLLLPVVHNQLLSFAEVEMEVVVLAPGVSSCACSTRSDVICVVQVC